MTYAKRAVPLAVASALVLCVLGAPAKLDHLAPTAAQHSRGGFRAGTHDTGIWGANLHKLQNISPPRWGPNSINNRPRPSFSLAPPDQSRQGTSNQNFGANAFNQQLGGASKLRESQQFGSSSTINRLVSANSGGSGYKVPTPAPTQQGYNYIPPKKPFNLYQPPPPATPATTTTTTTTTTTRRPPVPPSGLYQTPTKFRPIPVRPQTARPTTPKRPFVPAPSNLYQTPQVFRPKPQPQTARPTTPKRPFVPAPSNIYQTPQVFRPPKPQPQTARPTTPKRPFVPAPSNLYQTPQVFRPKPQPQPAWPPIAKRPVVPALSSIYQTPQVSRPKPQTPRPRPTPTTTTRRPFIQAPSNLYQTPQLPSSLYQTPQASNPIPQRTHPKRPTPKPGMMLGMPYDFAYGVNDAPSGNHYTREETHDGNVMRGQYRVLLPDGKTQVVTYFDDGNGFNAEVTYE